MSPEQILKWTAVVDMLIALGVKVKSIVAFLKGVLSPEDADLVLKQTVAGWSAAKDENEARIAELNALIHGA